MTEQSRAVAVAQPVNSRPLSVFSNMESFENGQRMARALVLSPIVPTSYQGEQNLGSALIAMDMANRMGLAPITVMQNLDIIEGRPSWRSTFIIGAINSTGLFSPLRFKKEDLGESDVSYQTWGENKGERVTKKVKVRNLRYTAFAVEKDTGEILEGPPVSIEIAIKEGWYYRKGSKWPTMPELMLTYRAATLFGRIYCPHILNGMPMADEMEDVAELRDVTPPATPAAPAKPEGRPSGVHAAMARGGKKAAPKTIEAEPQRQPDPEPDEVEGDAAGHEDMFTADDDYEPA